MGSEVSHAQRIDRILAKLRKARHKGLKCFGSDTHKFRLNPRVDDAVLAQFESHHRIVLPSDFRSFLRLAGNGGAGPYYGIYRLEESTDLVELTTDDPPHNPLALPCPLMPGMARDADWEKQFSDCISPYQGMLSIGTQGCTYMMGLIVTGEFAGRVVYLDEGGEPPSLVREPDFLSWYERWLDELLGGYDIGWFGVGMGGDEPTLLTLLDDHTTSNSDRVDAAYALRRLPKLSERGREEIVLLLRDDVAGVRAAACYVADKFAIPEATKLLPQLLHDSSADVQQAAIAFAMKAEPKMYRNEILELLHSDNAEVGRQAYFKLQAQETIPRDDLLRIIELTQHGGLRALAAHAVPWQPHDEDLLIRLLQDDEWQVRHQAVLGLRQIASSSSLDAAIGLLGRETNKNTIDSVLRMLGEIRGKRNADVLLAWAESEDDFHRLTAIDSLCKLGDLRIERIARASLNETRSPIRQDAIGFTATSHVKSIRQLVSESLCSSSSWKLRRLGVTARWKNLLGIKT